MLLSHNNTTTVFAAYPLFKLTHSLICTPSRPPAIIDIILCCYSALSLSISLSLSLMRTRPRSMSIVCDSHEWDTSGLDDVFSRPSVECGQQHRLGRLGDESTAQTRQRWTNVNRKCPSHLVHRRRCDVLCCGCLDHVSTTIVMPKTNPMRLKK